MAQSTQRVGEKTRSASAERASSNDSPLKKTRQIPAAYPDAHGCKVCDGKHCTGHCKF
jgi:hypothetical protein